MVNINSNTLLNSLTNSLSDLQVKYQNQGITYVSNNVNVVPRDENGVIVLQQNSNNPLLIIEPITRKIINASALRVLDTQFNYYKFPIRVDEELTNLDLDLDLNLQSQDIVFARYRPSADQRIPQESFSVDEIRSGITNKTFNDYSGIEFGEVLDGISQRFPNSYTISKELKNSGVDLRFRIKLQHRYDAPDASNAGVAFFSIIRASEQGLNRTFRTFENTSAVYPTIPGSINQYEVQNLEIDIVILNSEFEIGDQFNIGATSFPGSDTRYHTINALQSYWVITDASKNVDLWNQEINA